MADFLGIKADFVYKQRPSTLIEQKVEGLKQYVASYVFDHANRIMSPIRREVEQNVVYGKSGIVRRTGGLGKSLDWSIQKVNQYASNFILYFNEKVPYVRTHVGPFGSRQIIKPRLRDWMTLPFSGSAADRYMQSHRRPLIRDFTDVHMYWSKKLESPLWRRGVSGGGEGLFHGSKGVSVPRRIIPKDIHDEFSMGLDRRLPSLVKSAVGNFMRMNK